MGFRRAAAPRHRLLVLCYHNVGPTWRFPVPGSPTRRFALQMRALNRVATLVPLESALRTLHNGDPLPPRAVAVTFDDGYRDNLTLGMPVLRALDVPATIFLVPGFLSLRSHAWWERLGWALTRARNPRLSVAGRSFDLAGPGGWQAALGALEGDLKKLDHRSRVAEVEALVGELDPVGDFRADELFLDWDGARELLQAGASVGSHTMEHAILAREPAERQEADLIESRGLLENELGVPINAVAYPNGTPEDYDDATLAAAKHAGYMNALTTSHALVDPDTPRFEINRQVVDPLFPPHRLAASVVRDFVRARLRGDETGDQGFHAQR